uniref:NADH dehydrogenase [ubiquinone] 1 alpha subcomplex assembly factor 3 n=1 Tax=Meloidogyne hapla TaxID=6305 RepID=A0A1I8BVK3_MELHA
MRLQKISSLLLRNRRISRHYATYGNWQKDMDDVKSNKDEPHYELGRFGDGDVGPSSRVTLLSKDMEAENMSAILTVSSVGFRLVDKSFLFGPIAVFPKTTLSWRVLSPSDITPESLELFFLLQPKLDILIIGAGNKKDIDIVRKNVGPTITKARIGFEIMDTNVSLLVIFSYFIGGRSYYVQFLKPREIITLFVARYVAAALFPPSDYYVSDREHMDFISDVRGGLDGIEGNAASFGVAAIFDSLLAGEDRNVRSACYNIWGFRSAKAEEMVQVIHKMREMRKEKSDELLEEKRKISATDHTRLLQEMKERREAERLKKYRDMSKAPLVEPGEDSSKNKKE